MQIINDPDLSKDEMYELHRQLMKNQERIAIQALVAAKKSLFLAEKNKLDSRLEGLANELQSFTATSLPASLEAGFEGQAAQAAKSYLGGLARPSFSNPIQEV
ncbi:hypothetical protein [Streptococcus oricebi]|uniref:Uncharacterized protein n=1 Tax=Streptococcus oricebi TaxID=1547447 RepID=A0ABS5B3L9_9STRE|nr:hypothetical protein [Streptococcus oricebi]MBP2622564.1 hypothetical protein [Streptococcus oricebi]